MKPTVLAVLLVLAPVSVGVAAEPPAVEGAATAILADQPREVVEQLFEKRVVIAESRDDGGDEARFLQAFVLFEQPADRVFELLLQTARQAEYQTDLKEAITLEEDADGNLDEHHLKIAFFSIVYRVRHHWDRDARRLWWSLDPDFDNDVRKVEGFWELHALGEDRTLGRYGTVIDVGAALPDFLEASLTRRSVPAAMERVRRWVDSGGTFRPD
ncbi:MAG: hypothetical protein O7G30_02750 [Proteobacteria bacterium]|nr:hypothetical protein [Pseudomonadota bacterium]